MVWYPNMDESVDKGHGILSISQIFWEAMGGNTRSPRIAKSEEAQDSPWSSAIKTNLERSSQ